MPQIPWTDVVVRLRRLLVRRPMAHWVLATALALAAFGSVRRVTDAATTERRRWATSRPVLVATSTVAPGEPLDASVTELRRLPEAAVPESALVNRPAGLVASDALAPGEVVVAGHVSTGGAPGRLAPGTMGVPVPRPSGWTPAVGDHIAVVTTTDPVGLDQGPVAPSVIAPDAVVISVTDDGLLVAVPESDAPAVAAAGASGGAVVILRAG